MSHRDPSTQRQQRQQEDEEADPNINNSFSSLRRLVESAFDSDGAMNTAWGTVDMSATTATVDEDCPLVPPQVLPAGAAELERARTPGALSVRGDIETVMEVIDTAAMVTAALESIAGLNTGLTSSSRSRSNNSSSTASSSSTSAEQQNQISVDRFESVCLKMLGTRYQQLLSINGRLHKLVNGMHRDMVRVVDPVLETAEEAERLRLEQLAPALEHVRSFKAYAAQSIEIIGLARRKHNLMRLEAMLMTAGAWAERVDIVRTALRECNFVKALQTVGTSAHALSLDRGDGVTLHPVTALSAVTASLLDRKELTSMFDAAVKQVPLSDESFAELGSHASAGSGDPASASVFDDFSMNNFASASSSSAPPVGGGGLSEMMRDDGNNNNSETGNGSRNHHQQTHQRQDSQQNNQRQTTATSSSSASPEDLLMSDDVAMTFLGKVCFRRWRSLCDSSNPFVIDVVRRALCCSFAVGWRAIARQEEMRVAAEALQARLELSAKEASGSGLVAGFSRDTSVTSFSAASAGSGGSASSKNNNNNNRSGAAPPAPASSAGCSSRQAATSNGGTRNQRSQQPRAKREKKPKKEKTSLSWSSDDDDEEEEEEEESDYQHDDEQTILSDFADSETAGTATSVGGGHGVAAIAELESVAGGGAVGGGGAFTTTNTTTNAAAASGAAGGTKRKGKKKQQQKAPELFEWLLSEENRWWDSTASLPDVKATLDLAQSVHAVLVYMKTPPEAVERFVKESIEFTAQHILNYTFNDLFGEAKESWTQVAATLVPSEMERGVLRFCEFCCAFVNRSSLVARTFLASENNNSNQQQHQQKSGNETEAGGGAATGASAATRGGGGGGGLHAETILDAVCATLDKHISSFCTSVPWTRSSLAEVVRHFQLMRVTLCTAIPDACFSSEVRALLDHPERLPEAVRTLDYRIAKVVMRFSEKAMEDVVALMRSEMFSAFEATQEDFPETVKPLVMSSEEKARIWGEEFCTPMSSQPPSPDRGGGASSSSQNPNPYIQFYQQQQGEEEIETKHLNDEAALNLLFAEGAAGGGGAAGAAAGVAGGAGLVRREHLRSLRDGTDFVPVLLWQISKVDESCAEDATQPHYSPLDVGHAQLSTPTFTFSSSFCCRKMIEVTRCVRWCPAAASPLLRTVSSLACSYVWFVAQMFIAPNPETTSLEEDSSAQLSEGMRQLMMQVKQIATSCGCPGSYPLFPGQPCQMWRQMSLPHAQQCHAAEQRTGGLLSLPVVVSAYRRCVQCVAALLPAEDVQHHMELYDDLTTMVRWCVSRDMRRLGAAILPPEEVAHHFEKTKWDNAGNSANSCAAVTQALQQMLSGAAERLRATFQANQSAARSGLSRALREVTNALCVGILDGIARSTRRISRDHGRAAITNTVTSVFRSMRAVLPTVPQQIAETLTKYASVAGESNAEVLKAFIMANQSSFCARHLLAMTEAVDTGFLSRGNARADLQQLILVQFRKDENVTAADVLESICGEW